MHVDCLRKTTSKSTYNLTFKSDFFCYNMVRSYININQSVGGFEYEQ